MLSKRTFPKVKRPPQLARADDAHRRSRNVHRGSCDAYRGSHIGCCPILLGGWTPVGLLDWKDLLRVRGHSGRYSVHHGPPVGAKVSTKEAMILGKESIHVVRHPGKSIPAWHTEKRKEKKIKKYTPMQGPQAFARIKPYPSGQRPSAVEIGFSPSVDSPPTR